MDEKIFKRFKKFNICNLLQKSMDSVLNTFFKWISQQSYGKHIWDCHLRFYIILWLKSQWTELGEHYDVLFTHHMKWITFKTRSIPNWHYHIMGSEKSSKLPDLNNMNILYNTFQKLFKKTNHTSKYISTK